MELELGLTLSNGPPKIPNLKELDLISYVNYKGDQANEDEKSSNLSCESSVNEEVNCGVYQIKDDNNVINKKKKKKKRGYLCEEVDEVESSVVGTSMPITLALLLWDKHPNEDDDKLPKRLCNSTPFSLNKNEGDNIVGWPPIKSYRKKINDAYNHHHHRRHHHQQQQQHRRGGNFPGMEDGGRGGGCGGGSRSMFVKVQIEGCFITRKIDLKLYHSYQTLICCLLTMFGKGHDSMDDYKLTYQDVDGDWLLAGDVPWRTFIESVQRLKLRRSDD